MLFTRADVQSVDILVTVCLFFFVILCVCTVTDFSASDVEFCTAVHWFPGQGISHFGELCFPEAQNWMNMSLA